MDASDNDYHVSLFKPKTPHARANRDMVLLFFCIWAVAVFGFQVLLRVFEKPTPEPSYVAFEQVWPSIDNRTAGEKEWQILGSSVLSVLGKVAIKPEHRQPLQNVLSWSVFQLADSAGKVSISTNLAAFEKKKSEITSIADPDYIMARNALALEATPLLGLSAADVRSKILPVELASTGMKDLKEEDLNQLGGIMSTYLIHNQSFLTDARFLGFPFHYFYTALFLLVLFVGLCWLYCYRTDILNAKFNIAD
jgi:putative solute:sodium symporter small subunit